MVTIVKNRMFEEQGVYYSVLGLTEEEFNDLKAIMNQARIYALNPERCKVREWSDRILELYLKLDRAFVNTVELI